LKKKQKRVRELEHEIYMKRIPVVIVYEGWDAAGKGGNIRRLTQNLDPRGYEVVPIAAPNDIELAHHYLWRFWKEIPKAGHITIFDRSWYGRVMVERVEGFCSEAEWRRAYREINEMEQHIADFGTVLFKFWLHIDPEEQLRRFEGRQRTAHKRWKITDEDWRNRKKARAYKTAIEEMLFRTSTPSAPWTIVESNCKRFARIKVLDTVIDGIEARLRH
jgi:polyphosphate kinase 2 (PPK2 family)